jgi:hypothetical protein
MRKLVLAVTLVLSLASPAAAQMCGASVPGTTASGGMSCMGGQAKQPEDPFAEKPAAARTGMMCGCCRNMAMMGSSGDGGGAQHGDPGQPKAEPSKPQAPKP